jgi:hypothetical protein
VCVGRGEYPGKTWRATYGYMERESPNERALGSEPLEQTSPESQV